MLLTLLALAAPLPAMALNSDGSEPVTATPAPAALSVSTSLDSCGIVNAQVVCKLNVSFNPIDGADTYSATVTRADGSVVDYGGVGIGGASLWVPYVGPGGYSVRISAYGTPEGTDRGGRRRQGRATTTSATCSTPTPTARSRGPRSETGNASSDGIAGQRTTGRLGEPDAPGRPTPRAPTRAPHRRRRRPPPARRRRPRRRPPSCRRCPSRRPTTSTRRTRTRTGTGCSTPTRRPPTSRRWPTSATAAMAQQAQMPESIDC